MNKLSDGPAYESGKALGIRVGAVLARYRLAILLTGAIIIACISATVGLALYTTGGAAQLDLSRPGFEGVGEIIEQNKNTYVEYPDSGAIDQDALNQFNTLYKEQMENMDSIDAFGGDPLAPESLGIEAPLIGQ